MRGERQECSGRQVGHLKRIRSVAVFESHVYKIERAVRSLARSYPSLQCGSLIWGHMQPCPARTLCAFSGSTTR
jgi:hypothetical protein